jgi:hypothetical protein
LTADEQSDGSLHCLRRENARAIKNTEKADLDYKFCRSLTTMTMRVALIRFQIVTAVLAALACQSTDAFTLFPVLNYRSLQSPENLSTV